MIKVAIVEDKTDFRELWVDKLQHTEGYVFAGAYANLTEAVTGLPQANADIVLMDIQLNAENEQESGIEVIRRVREQCPNTQFLMFTIWEDDASIFESLKAGATGYILKKSTTQKVLTAIEELHEGGSPMSPAIARRVIELFQKIPAEDIKPEFGLTTIEENVLILLDKGAFYKEIAGEMNTTLHMVKQHCHTIYRKLEVANRQEAANKYRGRKS
jgi:two-component system, NarL family, response regulator LiaR